ncbi:nuclear receptor [Brachionus plicatilis]|uniref:Nuclear receptor n=1 Tax=Brachionus plicatilis TaxID=10195 RepID=A0A3M7QM28_BRAPC|nr:nuclear receptor [Brachionus plicatilis]
MFSNYFEISNQYFYPPCTLIQADLVSNYNKRKNLDSCKGKSKKTKYDYKCEVCGDLSSGYHYGAFTCEACKLFFSRTTKNKRKRKFDECLLKSCDINVQTRSDCSECRFKKCLFKGMSLTKSKFGRNVVFKNEPKPVNEANQSGKLVELFYQIGQDYLTTICSTNENNISQSEHYLRASLNYLFEKSIELIDITNKNENYKFLKNYKNFYFPMLDDRKLDALTVFDLYLEKINTAVSNISHSSAYLSLDQLEATNKIDIQIKEMIKNDDNSLIGSLFLLLPSQKASVYTNANVQIVAVVSHFAILGKSSEQK